MFVLMCLVYCTKEKLLVPISSISVIIAGLHLLAGILYTSARGGGKFLAKNAIFDGFQNFCLTFFHDVICMKNVV